MPAPDINTSSGSRPGREPAKITDWVQALAAVLAVVFAGWAALIALNTLRDQQQINRSQLALNQLAQDRAQKRYAARVAFWVQSKEGNTVYIQNRSPVPLTGLELSNPGWDDIPSFEVGDAPPCAVLTIRLFTAKKPGFAEQPFNRVGYQQLKLLFFDPNGAWFLDEGGVRSADGVALSTSPRGRAASISTPVEDCGEAG